MEKLLVYILLGISLSGCAALYHVQVSDISTNLDRGRIIDIKMSETGFDVSGAAKTSAVIAREARGQGDDVANALAGLELILALSNFGPRTGTPVFTDRYADILLDEIIGRCPSGKITGLTSVREARQYPYISGEIVNVRGYCVD